MKMETVIRSPQKGVVKRLAHKEGVSVSLQAYQDSKGTLANWSDRIFARPGRSWCCLRMPRRLERPMHNWIGHDMVMARAITVRQVLARLTE